METLGNASPFIALPSEAQGEEWVLGGIDVLRARDWDREFASRRPAGRLLLPSGRAAAQYCSQGGAPAGGGRFGSRLWYHPRRFPLTIGKEVLATAAAAVRQPLGLLTKRVCARSRASPERNGVPAGGWLGLAAERGVGSDALHSASYEKECATACGRAVAPRSSGGMSRTRSSLRKRGAGAPGGRARGAAGGKLGSPPDRGRTRYSCWLCCGVCGWYGH